jgi:DNA-directed RNA polymerase specialized sigma24 family protein
MSPGRTPTPADLLVDAKVRKIICATLLDHDYPKRDVEDGLQDVYVKALASFQRTAPPDMLDRMMALCAEIARNHAIDALRKAAARRKDQRAPCTRGEYGVLERVAQRDPVDAAEQLEVLADLFRKGEMPPDGVDILEGFASGCSYAEIARWIGITPDLAEWRLRRMKAIYRRRMKDLGLLPDSVPLRLVVSQRGAIPSLRSVA